MRLTAGPHISSPFHQRLLRTAISAPSCTNTHANMRAGASGLPSCQNAGLSTPAIAMLPTLLLSAALTAQPQPEPVRVSPSFHAFDDRPKQELVLDKQLARPAPIRFESRAALDAQGRLRLDCDSVLRGQSGQMPDFGVHLRRR